VDDIKKLITDFSASNKALIDQLEDQSEKASDICNKLDRSWSGFPYGDNAYYYYENFLPPPSGSSWNIEWGLHYGVKEGWVFLQGDEIKKKIEKTVGNSFTIKQYNKDGDALLAAAVLLKENILIELSTFEFDEKMVKEKELYSAIEAFSLGDIDQLRADYINGSRAMGSFTSRDSKALMQGRVIPSHITSAAGVYAVRQVLENITKFIALTERFTKQMEKKINFITPIKDNVMKNSVQERLENVFNKFHRVAQQLKVRHGSRTTLEIKDEYDVQDLLHSVLNIDFDDIRAEEWTPSYAGSSTRMDFLLKQEKIVVEVKIASNKLKDKELGSQLILDIAHYGSHSDCKTLYCFVYDPQFILTKKSSLVNDLEKKHNELDVKIFIRP